MSFLTNASAMRPPAQCCLLMPVMVPQLAPLLVPVPVLVHRQAWQMLRATKARFWPDLAKKFAEF